MMGFWQIFVIVYDAMVLGLFVALHGKPRDGEYSLPLAAFTIAIGQLALWLGGWYAKN